MNLEPGSVETATSEFSVISPTSRLERTRNWARSGRVAVALRGGAWTLVGYISTQLLRTVGTLVLARHFLGPEPFGLVGLVGVFIAGLSMFSELGILANVVQHPRGDDPDFLNTAFSIQVGRGVCIWLACLVAAYPVAVFYHERPLFSLLVVAALAQLIQGCTSTALWTLTRHVQLRNVVLLQIVSEVLATAIAIVWAVVSPSAWALVARTVVAAAVSAIGSHLFLKQKVHLGWDRAAARDILHFGGWISISTAAFFLGGQGERLILGKFVSAAEIGCFSLALMICTLPAAGVSQMVGQIFLPMLSKTVRTSRADTVRDLQRVRPLFFAIGCVAALGFLILAKPFVAVVLNSKYAMTGWMLQLLGIRVAFDVFAAPASNLVLAYGKTKYSAAGNATRLFVMVGGVWIAFTYFGLREAIVALVIAQAVSYFPLIAGIRKFLPEVVGSELRWYAALLAIVSVAAFAMKAGF
jgi:O-antigen/teichoic acid export membrane protein